MAQAKSRGSFEQRKAEAIAAGRTKQRKVSVKPCQPHPVLVAFTNMLDGIFARAKKTKEQ